MSLINCEVELHFLWTRCCVFSEDDDNLNNATFQSAKLYVPVVTLSKNNSVKFLENLKQGFKKTIFSNKHRSEIRRKSKNLNLDYMIDPTFRSVNRLFVLSFKNGDNDPTRNLFNKYCMLLVEIKDFNALIDNKSFFDQPIKNKQEAYEKLVKMSKSDNYTTVNLLNYSFHQNY